MKSRILFFLMAMFSFAISSCSSDSSDSSDEPEPPILEDSYTHNLRMFSKRYNLPEDKILSLKNLQGIGENNIGVYYGINEDNEVAMFICDTIANKALYSDFSAVNFEQYKDFSLPYGEKKNLDFSSFNLNSIAINSSVIAFSSYAIYGVLGSNNSAFLKHRFIFANGKLSVIELPIAVETLYKREEVINWHDNSVLFHCGNLMEYPNLKSVSCYDKNGNLLYEAPYPHFIDGSHGYRPDLFGSRVILQPISNSVGLGIEESQGKICAFSIDIVNHCILWCKDEVEIPGYEYKNSDRIELEKTSFSNNVIDLSVFVTSYNGDKQTFKCKVTTEGNFSFEL